MEQQGHCSHPGTGMSPWSRNHGNRIAGRGYKDHFVWKPSLMVALLGASADVSLSREVPRVPAQTSHFCLWLLLRLDPARWRTGSPTPPPIKGINAAGGL